MKRTVETSPCYGAWPATVAQDIAAVKTALGRRNLELLGETAEANALAMHATMIAARPPVLYWKPESIAAMQQVWRARAERVPVYFTMDAGPNLTLLFTAADQEAVLARVPALRVVAPLARPAHG